MFRIIPFEEIEKNKWNGTVHYSTNGNVFGYHWYLKALVGEWDALVENDYETVLPIFKQPLKPHQYSLLMESGPYSVNPMTDPRVEEILEILHEKNKSSQYPLHSIVSKRQLEKVMYKTRKKAVLGGGFNYEKLSKNYSDDLKYDLLEKGYDAVKVNSGLKPELLVSLSKENEDYKNAMMRIMYNAMHRGIGFSSAIEDRSTGKVLAASFFVNTNATLIEVFSTDRGGKKYRQLIYDLMLRNNSGSPYKFETFFKVDDLHEMGFDSEPVFDLQLKRSVMINFRKSFGRAH